MKLILDVDEAWSLMTLVVSQMVDKAGLSSDGKAKLRRWRSDRANGTAEMAALTIDMNEALGSTLEELVALRPGLDRIDPDACRARVDRHFTHQVMAAGYLRMFREFLATGVLPAGELLEAWS